MVNGWNISGRGVRWTELMWEHYKKTLIPMQLMIVALCVTVYFVAGKQLVPVAIIFVIMQLGSLAGAAWAARIRRRMTRNPEDLPLKRR